MEILTNALAWFTENFSQLIQIIGAAAVVATMTPNKSDDKIVQFILDAVNFLGGNMGKAKNGE